MASLIYFWQDFQDLFNDYWLYLILQVFATNVFEILILQHSILKLTENDDCEAKTRLKAPETLRITSIFEISALELTKLT